MKVLILCNDFPPLNSIGAQRPYSWFIHLKKFGVTPTVITKNWSGESASAGDVLTEAKQPANEIEQNEHGRIIRVPLKIILPEKLLLKYGEQGYRLVRKMFTFIYKLLSFVSLRFDKHAGIYLRARKLLKQEKFDAILITGEPFILFRYGYLLSKQFNTPWIPDYRDGWVLNHVIKHHTGILNRVLQWWEFRFEKKYILSAKLILSIDPLLAERLSKLHHKESAVVYNGFDGFYTGQPAKNGSALALAHVGTLTPGQRVEILLQAIKELHNEEKIKAGDLIVKFTGIEYFPGQHKRIISFDESITPYLKTTPRIARQQALAEMAASDFLISLTEPEYKAIFAKTYDYVAAKKPILVIPDDGSILTAFVKKLNAGYIFTDVEGVKSFLQDSIQQKKNGTLAGSLQLNTEAALFYTREKQAGVLAEILKTKLGIN